MTSPTEPSTVELFAAARPVSMDALSGEVVALVGGGIVNPFGPTLLLTVLTGLWHPDSDMPIIRASLNPFSQELEQVGIFKVRGLFDPVDTLLSVVPRSIPGCPTALLVSPLLHERARDVIAVTAQYLSACEQAKGTLDGVRQFTGDPRSRVKHEIDAGMKLMFARERGEAAQWPESRRLTPEEAVELTRIQLVRNHWLEEWRGLVMCWSESIDNVRGSGAVRTAMPFARVESLVSALVDATDATMAATFPDWRRAVSTS